MLRAEAFAKVNLGLRVERLAPDGYHPLHGFFQSVGWADEIRLERSEQDSIENLDDGPVPDGDDNLAMQAVLAIRHVAGVDTPVRVQLRKRIPAAAGLGGGSADAAAALILAAELFGQEPTVVAELAPQLGSDVPFCVTGGTARVSGRGELIDKQTLRADYHLGIVVPPVELSTAAVFARWDELREPRGEEPARLGVPPGLRAVDLGNDLWPAAVALVPQLADWRADLERSWARAVLMSGSGPALFGFFMDSDEAIEALQEVPVGVRAAQAVAPVSVGWRIIDE